MIVTIDGPAGSGKSTAAKGLAERLGFEFLDTGAMYRCVAWAVIEKQVEPTDEAAVVNVSQQIQIAFSDAHVLVNDVEVTGLIRTPEVTEVASVVAQYPGVREELVRLQRDAASGTNIVSEGRDQGTEVFPGAECKFYLTADARIRTQRRFRELSADQQTTDFDTLLQQIEERDRRDAERSIAPLRPADDAIIIDTGPLAPDEVVRQMVEIIEQRRQGGSHRR